MRATWRPLAAWLYPPAPHLNGSRQRASWDDAMHELEREIAQLDGSDVVIGVVVPDDAISFSGGLKAGGRTRFGHHGVEVSFDAGDGRLVFHTDVYDDVRQNLRAIGLGLEALRAVDRQGISQTGQQYAGFAMLPPGGPSVERGRRLVEEAGGIRAAEFRHHPDQGGNALDFADVQAYKAQRTGK